MTHDKAQNIQTKLDPNPLVYLIDGLKRLIHTNLKTALLVFALNVGLLMLIPIFFISLALRYDNALDLFNATKANLPLLAILLIVFAIAGYVSKLALDRVVITGVRSEAISPSQSIKFGAHRFLPALIINAIIALIILIPTGLVILGMITVSPWMGLLFLPVIVAFIVFSFFVTPIQFILVDSAPINNVASVFRRLFSLWKHGFVALLIYLLGMGFVSGGLSSFPGGSLPSSSDSNSSTSSSFSNYFNDNSKSDSVFSDKTLNNIKFDFPRWIVLPISSIFLLVAAFSLATRTVLETGLARLYTTISERTKKTSHTV